MSSASEMSDNPTIKHLCDADAEALDAILASRAAGSDFVAAASDSRDRVDGVSALLGLLERDVAEDPPADLVQRTLAHTREAQQRQRFAEQVQMLSEPRRTIGVSWRQLVAAASIFLIAASLLMPVLERNRAEAHRVVGASNLGAAGIAIQKYAHDNNQLLPQRAIRTGDVWWNVGQPIDSDNQPVNSNSAQIYVLVRAGYIEPEKLASPANPNAPEPGEMTAEDHDWHSPDQVSYSYQNQYGRYLIRVDKHALMPVLADRNPIFVVVGDKILFDPDVPLNAPSRAHNGTGQNILLLDGRVIWTERPEVTGPTGRTDNIWGAHGQTDYDGDETPNDPNDSFLVP